MKPTWAKSVNAKQSSYQLDDLVVEPAQRAVSRYGVELPFSKLTFDLLLLLVESAPNLVTLTEITEALWQGRVVTEDTVRQRIKLLRKALSDDPTDPRYLNVIRGQGIRLIPDVKETTNESANGSVHGRFRLAYIAAAAIVATTAIAYWPSTLDVPPEEPSIAVLPFETLSTESEDAFFVDGFHNDLLTQLAGIDDLKVISRTSVIEYRDNARNIREIGRQLGVATILEGSIQRSGDMVRINAQLIDAVNDKHLWAEAYDREITPENLFDVQAEMAAAVSSALQVELSPQENARLREAPTRNIKAYNHYVLARRLVEYAATFNGGNEVLSAFQNAVDEDPQFAEAWAALAITHSTRYFFADRTESRREQANHALDQALSLKPDHPDVQLAIGFVRYHTERDYEGALAAWEEAEKGMPNDARLFHARAAVYARMGRIDQAVMNWERATELDPRNSHRLLALAWHRAMIGDYDGAQVALERVVTLIPDKPVGYERLAFLPLWRDGDGAALREALDVAPIPVRATAMLWLASIYERDYSAAFELLEQWPIENVDTPLVFRPKSWFVGITFKMSGNVKAANEQFHAAKFLIEGMMESRPDDLRLKITLADISANLGNDEEAVELVTEVLTNMPPTLDATASANYRLYAIRTLLTAGHYDAAISELDTYLSTPTVWSLEGLLPDPRFDPIREDPRFREVVARHSRG